MDISWGSFWLGFTVAPAIVVAAAVVYVILARALDRNIGVDGCHVCEQAVTCDIGQHTRLGIWVRNRRHNWVVKNTKWHRDAWARSRWNPYRLPGYPQDNGIAVIRRPRPALVRRIWWAVVS